MNKEIHYQVGRNNVRLHRSSKGIDHEACDYLSMPGLIHVSKDPLDWRDVGPHLLTQSTWKKNYQTDKKSRIIYVIHHINDMGFLSEFHLFYGMYE